MSEKKSRPEAVAAVIELQLLFTTCWLRKEWNKLKSEGKGIESLVESVAEMYGMDDDEKKNLERIFKLIKGD